MHYANGREAKNGDKVVWIPTKYKQADGSETGNAPVSGILYDAVAGQDYCNGKIAPTAPSDPMPNLREVLHVDDVAEYLASVKK